MPFVSNKLNRVKCCAIYLTTGGMFSGLSDIAPVFVEWAKLKE